MDWYTDHIQKTGTKQTQKIADKTSKNKKWIQTDNCIKETEENDKEKNIRNPYKGVGSLKGGFKCYTNLYRHKWYT